MEDQLGDSFKINKVSFETINQLKPITVDYLFSEKLNDFASFKPNWDGISQSLAARQKTKTNRSLLVKTLNSAYQKAETSKFVLSNITQLSESNTFTFTTGHQLNLFTGPSYFFYKIFSVIKLSIQAKQKFPDFNFVPVFWMASEDHDFEEIASTLVNNQKITWQKKASGAVGRLDLEGLQNSFELLKKEIGLNTNTEDFFKSLETFLANSETYGQFVFKMVNHLFKDFGLVVLDADNKDLKKELIPVIQEDIFHQLTKKGADKTSIELEEKGYSDQILVRDINFFYLKDNLRERIEKHDNFYKVLNSSISFSGIEMMEEIKNHPERFSPNVSLRPVYQEILLPNLAYVGGGAEVSYWLQLKQSFINHEVFFPVVLLRDSAAILTNKVAIGIEDLELEFTDLFRSENDLFKSLVKLKTKHSLNLSNELESISSLFDSLKSRAIKIQPTLQRTVEGEKVKILNRLQSIEKKFLREEKRNHKNLENKLQKVLNKLYPNGVLQERKANFLPYFLEYKDDVFNTLIEEFDPTEASFKFLISKN